MATVHCLSNIIGSDIIIALTFQLANAAVYIQQPGDMVRWDTGWKEMGRDGVPGHVGILIGNIEENSIILLF